jgi:hypothetical protein
MACGVRCFRQWRLPRSPSRRLHLQPRQLPRFRWFARSQVTAGGSPMSSRRRRFCSSLGVWADCPLLLVTRLALFLCLDDSAAVASGHGSLEFTACINWYRRRCHRRLPSLRECDASQYDRTCCAPGSVGHGCHGRFHLDRVAGCEDLGPLDAMDRSHFCQSHYRRRSARPGPPRSSWRPKSGASARCDGQWISAGISAGTVQFCRV